MGRLLARRDRLVMCLDRVDETAAMYEELICKVQGVYSAKVKIDDADGEIIECHVLADRTRNVKQLVRDVQSALMAKFRVDLDYKLISVAQVDNLESIIAMSREEDSAEPPKPESPRAQLKSFMMGYEGSDIKAFVKILVSGQEYMGEASGSNGAGSRYRTLAQAVVNAVNYNVGEETALSILDVQKFNINGQGAYAVAIFCRRGGREETLLGAAMIRDDENLSVVKAALDALNRRLFSPKNK
jgi:hypothetical protein